VKADPDTIMRALRRAGEHPESRRRLTQALRDVESLLAREGFNVREEITGPLVDALHGDVASIDLELSSGIGFSVLYTGKIARDVAMRVTEHPDHVFEPQTTKTLLRLARDARHVVIGGAYSGDHAVLIASQIAAHGGIVHAFEPNSRQLAMLEENAARNGLTNLRGINLGLWYDESTRLDFVGTDELAQTTPADDGAIAVTTIDAYCAREGIDAVDMIMLDIEGSEHAALRGARRILENAHAPNVVFEIHGSYVDWSQGLRATPIGTFLASLGYELYSIRDFQSHVAMTGLPVELVPADSSYLEGPPHGFNMLATKNAALTSDPLFRIVESVSPKLLHHRDRALHYPLAWQDA
jgi:FkbM family methyltransferase